MNDKKSPLDLIRSAKLPERSVPICMRGDLVVEHEELCTRLAAAQMKNAGSLAGNSEAHALAEDIAALERVMSESTVVFQLRALPRQTWATLVAAYPPRRDEGGRVLDSDSAGVHVDHFMEAVLEKAIVEPQLGHDDYRLLINERLTDAQYGQLTEAVWSLNRREVDVPFSLAASRILRASAPE